MAAEELIMPRLRRLDRITVGDRSRAFAGVAFGSATSLLEGSESVLRLLSMLLAMLATSAFLITDADGGRGEWALWLQIVVESLLSVCLWWLLRYVPAGADRRTLTAVAAISVLVLSLLWEPVQRVLLGSGRPFEMMMMHSQRI